MMRYRSCRSKLGVALASLLIQTGSSPIRAAEVDQFTGRFDEPPADSSTEINRRCNELLLAAVEAANQLEGRGWQRGDQRAREARLYKQMRKEFNNHIRSDFVMELIERGEEIEGIELRYIRKEESIFADWKLGDGVVIAGRRADENPLALSPLIRIGEVTIGVDKIEHLFERGWKCFENKYRLGMSDAQVISLSLFSEKVIFGGNRFATGVFSYADIVANFNGMRFWNAVVQNHDDILGAAHNAGPYVIWADGTWRVNPEKPIDLRHFVDWGMDEGINCSRYASRSGARKVREALEELNQRDPEHEYNCPMEPEKLHAMRRKYGRYADRMLNYDGIGRRGLIFER